MSLYSTTETGLLAITQALQTSSDNLANSQTDGYKSELPIFETLLGNNIGADQVGGGAAVTGIQRNFAEGSINQTGISTDLAIQGDGFFIYQNSGGAQLYSRNGQITADQNGFLSGPGGQELMGFGVDAAGNAQGVLGPLSVSAGLIQPAASTKVALTGNLDASDPVLTGTIDPTKPATYNYSTSVPVYDSLGNSHVLTYFFQNAGPDSGNPGDELWKWTATLDGTTTGLANNTGTLDFDSTGKLVIGGTPASSLTATLTDGAASLKLGLNFTALTQYASTDLISGIADGNSPGQPSGVQIDATGLVSITYSNGIVKNAGRVAIATFASDQGLQLAQGGMFLAGAAAGQATVGIPGAGTAGQLQV
ncbi:MAG: flagellar hook protein FlgE, partial [Candidatus Binataceae bacterium]